MDIGKLKPGQTCVVVNIKGSGSVRRRLLDMGITPGTCIRLCKKAPLGDPIQISLRGYYLMLGKAQARLIEVCNVQNTKEMEEECR